MLKHLAAFFLLAVFLYHLVGVYPAALWQQHTLRRAAEARRHAALPDRALVRISVSRAAQAVPAVVWHETEEFTYRGQLYDVVRQRVTPDSVTYFCWPDHEEEQLLAQVAAQIRELVHPDASTHKSAKKVFDYLAKLVFLVPEARPALCPLGHTARLSYPTLTEALCYAPQEVPVGPPRA